MTGNFARYPPFYLRAENYASIRSNLSSLHLHGGELNTVLAGQAGRYDGFYLSDVFEYMDDKLFESTIDRIIGVTRRGARIVYWNNLVMREPAPCRCLFKHERLSKYLFKHNRAFFYGSLVVLERK
jgi:S-adenosylmethionine-diacylglycerol 3-amino-3-carboxypropyl transferase